MDPVKMRAYGEGTDPVEYAERRGVEEVVGHAFCSDYQENLAKALLLRDFGVGHLNRLLEKTEADVITRSE